MASILATAHASIPGSVCMPTAHYECCSNLSTQCNACVGVAFFSSILLFVLSIDIAFSWRIFVHLTHQPLDEVAGLVDVVVEVVGFGGAKSPNFTRYMTANTMPAATRRKMRKMTQPQIRVRRCFFRLRSSQVSLWTESVLLCLWIGDGSLVRVLQWSS